jgi:two-component sensor histidine kinase
MSEKDLENNPDVAIIRVLIIENDENVANTISQAFESYAEHFRINTVRTLKTARSLIAESRPDLIVADYLLPDGWGIEFLSNKEGMDPLPLIVMVKSEDQKLGLKALNSGALDYVVKSEASLSDIPHVADRAMRNWMTLQEYKQESEQLQASLKDKEVILKEIHHRIKNNFQVVCSVLSLQSQYIKNSQVLDMFMEIQDRVRAMALIHEKLYQSQDVGRMDFAEYVENLVNGLFWSYGVDPNKLKLDINVEDVSLGVELTVPCGLIINELVSNSLKYAFPESWKGEGKIEISLVHNEDESLELNIKDNGVGIPEGVEVGHTDTFGLELVTILAEDQLNGSVKLNRGEGTEFQIIFRKRKRLAY